MSKSALKNQVGVIGMGVMGANLALNFASHGISISVFNRHKDKVDGVMKQVTEFKYTMDGFGNLGEFIDSLDTPRKVILMVPAGDAVDQTIEQLLPFLAPNDLIIDCGNSFWKDTVRREKELLDTNITFIGCGVSGGSEGALLGPSIMPGGDKKSVDDLLPLLEKISAKDFKGNPCVTNVGLSGAGHFVKMVHNGIEYAVMQGISEVYDALKKENLNNQQILSFFERANSGVLKSYLLDITVDIFRAKDGDVDLIDLVSDVAKAKGTGGWTVQSAMELGVNTPTIAAAVFARIASAKNQFFSSHVNLKDSIENKGDYPDKEFLLDQLIVVLEGVYMVSYLQGLDLIIHANNEFDWNVDTKEVIRIWQGGCIIRSQMLEQLHEEIQSSVDVGKYLWSLWFQTGANAKAIMPVITSCYVYLQTLQTSQLATNLIQAQRDYFGSHTYKRIDKEGDFTGDW
jgi:6-phosphogluconate dehydrogenase